MGMIYRIIKASGHPDLVEVLRTAMSRSRKDAISEVRSQSGPLLKHLIPLIALKKALAIFPNSWPVEIREYLSNIDLANGRKKDHWLRAEEIEREINETLTAQIIVRVVMKKMEPFPKKTQKIVQTYLNALFTGEPVTLKNLGVSLQHEKSEMGYELSIFIDGKKL
jgi:hypothetical protein